ncbi:MAG TPA: thioredoxin family protein [Candidatus Eisenbacteria bacterium]|nr:thioredoxin family protein [Candidatus Eisenbacteria bacterium]
MKSASKTILAAAVLAASTIAGAPRTIAATEVARVGEPAPDFAVVDTKGATRHLSDFKGKVVVLEWHNQGCPFVKKHYGSGNMQRLQKEITAQGGVWLTVISSAPGKQGFVTPAEEDAYLAAENAVPTAVLLDGDGKVGRLYGAKTTPHMYLVDAKGVLVYAGAIDDRPSADASDVDGAKNYVLAAYQETTAGKPVTVATTAPYGCSVKYGD